jgi:hypothetical protein
MQNDRTFAVDGLPPVRSRLRRIPRQKPRVQIPGCPIEGPYQDSEAA